MTNREKINKMTNEEFAKKFTINAQLCEACAYWKKSENYCTVPKDEQNGSEFNEGYLKWLSRETEPTAEKDREIKEVYGND